MRWVYEDRPYTVSDTSADTCSFFAKRCIVAPTNEAAALINNHILESSPEAFTHIYSHDMLIDDVASEEHYPLEFLHTIETAGLPPHVLRVRRGCVLVRVLSGPRPFSPLSLFLSL